MASYFEIYIARHAEGETKLRRRETIEEFRRTVPMVTQDAVKDTFELLKAMAESKFEEFGAAVSREATDESSLSAVSEPAVQGPQG